MAAKKPWDNDYEKKFQEKDNFKMQGEGMNIELPDLNWKILIPVVVVLLAITFGYLNMRTGSTVKVLESDKSSLEGDLTTCNQENVLVTSNYDNCKSDLDECDDELDNCKGDLTTKTASLTLQGDYEEELEECEDDRDNYKLNYESYEDELDDFNDLLDDWDCDDVDDLDDYIENQRNAKNNCLNEKSNLQTNYNSMQSNYIQDFCCSRGYSYYNFNSNIHKVSCSNTTGTAC